MSRPFDPVITLPISQQTGATFPRLVELMQRLLADDGCPWDREQTFHTLRKYVLEEACEVIDAIESGDRNEHCNELGDLLLQVVFQAELGRRENSFGPDSIVQSICDKLVRRHPHVFGDTHVDDANQVLQNWERIKAKERSDKGVLSGVPRSLPALTRAQRIGEKVARVGFDWPDARGSREKLTEEIAELDEAIASGNSKRAEAELGDVLFALINLARHANLDAESALRQTIDKFTQRFDHVESRVKQTHGGWPEPGQPELTLQELDQYWDEAKTLEQKS